MSQQLPADYDPFGPMREEYLSPQPMPPSRKRTGLVTWVLTFVLILAVAVLVNESLLRIRAVGVVGNQRFTWDQIIDAAGLRGGVTYFTLNEKKIADSINSNRYLVFEGMEKHFPDSVTLYIRERQPRANVQVMGITYVMDEEGMVLEQLGNVQPNNGLITVTGFQTREIRVGQIIVPSMGDQMTAFEELIREVILQDYTDQVSELNLSNPDSLYLITSDGYTAHLGDLTDMRAKIGTVRAVVQKLREMGRRGGMLEASVPGVATFMPMDQDVL